MPSLKLKLEFPADHNAKINSSLAIGFVCEEGVNRLYRLNVLLAIPSTSNVKIDNFLGQTLALEAKWEVSNNETEYDNQANRTPSGMKYSDAAHRVFYAQVHDCVYLGESGEHVDAKGERTVHRFFMLEAGPKAKGMTASANSRVYIPGSEYGGDATSVKPSGAVQKLMDNQNPKVKYTFMKNGDGASYQPGFDHPLPFIVQYRESNFDFLLRWVERQGWHFLFKFFSDSGKYRDGSDRLEYHEEEMAINEKAPFIPLGVNRSQYTHMAKVSPSHLGLVSLRERLKAVPSQVVAHDYAPDASREELTAKYPDPAESGNSQPLFLEDEFFASAAEGKKLAQTRMESLKSLSRFFTGSANLPGFAPGRAFLPRSEGTGMTSQDSKWLTESHFILSTRHAAAATDLAADLRLDARDIWEELPEVGYLVRFESIKFANVDTYHPPRTTRWPRIAGTVTAFTVPLGSSENYAVAMNDSGCYHLWLEGVQPMPKTAGQAGSVGPVRSLVFGVGVNSTESSPLNAGTEVAVSFSNGNPDRPLIVGAAKNNYSLSKHPYNAVVFQRENGSKFSSALDRNIDLWNLSSPGGNPFFDAISDYSSTFLTHNTTFYNSNARLYSSRLGGFATNSNTFYNSMSAGSDLLTSVFKVLGTAANVTTKSLSLGNVSLPSQGAANKLTASISNGPMQFVFSVLALLSMSEQRERLLLSSNQETAALGTRGFFPKTSKKTKSNLGLVITKLALDMINETLGVLDSAKTRKAQYDKQENDYKGVDNPDSVKRWRPLPIDPDLLKTIPDLVANVLVYTKIIGAICGQSDDSSGLRISTIRASGAGIMQTIKSKLIAMFLPTPPIVGRQDNGMTLVVESDGQTSHLSDEGIALQVHPKATLKENTAPAANQVALLNLSGPNRPVATGGVPDPTQPIKPTTSRIGMSANDIALETVADLNLLVKKNLNLAANLAGQTPGSRLGMFGTGDLHVEGTGIGSTHFAGGAGASAKSTYFQHGKNVVIAADKTGGGLIVGVADANGIAANSPSIRINSAKNKAAQILKNFNDLVTARKELLTAMSELEALTDKIERQQAIKRANPTDVIKYNAAQATLTPLIVSLPTAKTKVQTALTKANTAKTTFTQEAIGSGTNLELVNGSNETEKVTLEAKKVMVESAKDIIVKADKNAIHVSHSIVEIKSNGKCTISGTNVAIA